MAAGRLQQLVRPAPRHNLQFAVINLPLFASAAVRLGLGELVDTLGGHPATPWTDAVRASVAGGSSARRILQQIRAKPDEAEARLRAAEQLMAQGRASRRRSSSGRRSRSSAPWTLRPP